jgi:sulfate transport system ATP-binding protein
LFHENPSGKGELISLYQRGAARTWGERPNSGTGRSQNGQVKLGPLTVPSPDPSPDARNGVPMIEATVRHIAPVGRLVRLELARRDNGERLDAEITRERFNELDLHTGEDVHVKPRKLQVFLGDAATDYSI